MTTTPSRKPRNPQERGSILIFVVGVLVLLALSATAYLATARTDRVATRQNQYNTQVDLLLESCVNALMGAISGDTAVADKISDFINSTSPWGNQSWLASRVPVTFDGNQATALSGANPAAWRVISGPIFGSQFEDPTGKYTSIRANMVPGAISISGTTMPGMIFDTDSTVVGGPWSAVYLAADADGDGVADSMLEPLPIGVLDGVRYYVAYRVIDNGSAINVNTALSRNYDFISNGTTIQNAGFFVGNAGLAEFLTGYDPTVTGYPRFDLMDGTTTRDFDRLNAWRNNSAANAVPDGIFGNVGGTLPIEGNVGTSATPRADFRWLSVSDAMQSQLAQRIDNPGHIRAGTVAAKPFTLTDSMALASRFVIADALSSPSNIETQLKDSVYGDGVTGPLVPKVAYTPGQAQGTWFTSLFQYTAENPVNGATFKTRRPLLTATANIRNLVPTVYTAGSPFTLALGNTPKVSINTGVRAELDRAFLQVLTVDGLNLSSANNDGVPFPVADIDAAYAAATFDPYQGMKWGIETNDSSTPFLNAGFPSHPARMYRNVIRLSTKITNFSSPAQADTAGSRLSRVAPGSGQQYDVGFALLANQVAQLRAAIATINLESLRQFHSAGVNSGSPNQPDVATFREITLTLQNGQRMVVRVFPWLRQPYVTEIFAHSDAQTPGPIGDAVTAINPNGYVAIELYNPHEVAIDISNCRIGLLARHSTSRTATSTPPFTSTVPYMTLVDAGIDLSDPTQVKSNMDLNTVALGGFSPMVIPPKGYLVLENYDANATPDPTAATYRPGGAVSPTFPSRGSVLVASAKNANVMYVKNLHLVFNREFVLMRPFQATIEDRQIVIDGFSAKPNQASLVYRRPTGVTSPPALRQEYMPLDSYDFSGIPVTLTAEDSSIGLLGMGVAWHYQRYTKTDAAVADPLQRDLSQWRFIYPGRYDAAYSDVASGTEPYPRQQGTLRSAYWTPGTDLSYRDPWDPSAEAPPTNVRAAGFPPLNSPVLNPKPSLAEPNPDARQHNFFSIPMCSPDSLGVFPVQGAVPNRYPFGRFGRLGDLLQVPFIGSYLIYHPADITPTTDQIVLEMNSVTMDAAMAEDTDAYDDPIDTYGSPAMTADGPFASREQIGRFAPLRPTLPDFATDGQGVNQNLGNPAPEGSTATAYDDYATDTTKLRYHFSKRLFDFFTLHSPADDYFPNVKTQALAGTPAPWNVATAYGANAPVEYPAGSGNFYIAKQATTGNTPFGGLMNLDDPYWGLKTSIYDPTYRYYNADGTWVDGAPPVAVRNGSATAADRTNAPTTDDDTENTEPVRGQINLNTAPAKVLAMIPWAPFRTTMPDAVQFDPTAPEFLRAPGNGIDDNEDFAKAFVYWRDGDPARSPSPLQPGKRLDSLFDLYRVPPFQILQLSLLQTDPDDAEGDLSPYNGAGTYLDHVRNDYEEQFLALNRVSNLVTTRSDTFTAYILLQGWRNTGTASPELVVERRAAMIIDRGRFAPSNGFISSTRVPTN